MPLAGLRSRLRWRLGAIFALLAIFAIPSSDAQSKANKDARAQSPARLEVPLGTILPVRFNQTISSKNAKPGQSISARLMQGVPLPDGNTIPAGAKVLGKVTEVQPSSPNSPGKITLLFDTLSFDAQSISILASLRALAGFMEVQEAQTPEFSPGFGTPSPWITTRQIGGDEVYGVGGPVTNRWSERVGTSVNGGVLVQVRAQEGCKCGGPLNSENRSQALWVFSADACGVYGLEHVQIAHAGRSDPTGAIALTSDAGEVKLRPGDALLLRLL